MTTLDFGVEPGNTRALQIERAKGWTAAPERKETGADVVHEAGPGPFFAAQRPTRTPRIRLEQKHAVATLRQGAGCGQAVRARANDHHVRVVQTARSLPQQSLADPPELG